MFSTSTSKQNTTHDNQENKRNVTLLLRSYSSLNVQVHHISLPHVCPPKKHQQTHETRRPPPNDCVHSHHIHTLKTNDDRNTTDLKRRIYMRQHRGGRGAGGRVRIACISVCTRKREGYTSTELAQKHITPSLPLLSPLNSSHYPTSTSIKSATNQSVHLSFSFFLSFLSFSS